jgi:hypothetical protein
MIPRMPLMCFCGVLVGAFFFPDRVMAQIRKVDGYDDYKFGMTIDQALKVRPAAKQKTPCDYVGVPVCLEYATTVSVFSATVNVQFEGDTPLLSQILITISSLDEPVPRPCREVGKEVLSLLVGKYGKHPFIKDHEATWTSPDGGSVSLLALCVGENKGVNVISYRPSSPL